MMYRMKYDLANQFSGVRGKSDSKMRSGAS